MTYRGWLITVFAMLFATVVPIVAGMVWVTRAVRAPDFLVSMGDPTLVVEEKAFHMRDAKCDVLIYGDSSTMTGVDPRVITADTGLSACNIAVTWPVVSLLGTMPVDVALEHNPAPKYLVFQLAPRTFYVRNNWDEVANLGPFSMLLRQRPGWATDWTIARHGDRAIEFFWQVFLAEHRPDPKRMADFHRLYDSRLRDYDQNGGLLSLAVPAQTSCLASPDVLSRPLDRRWPDELRRRYQKGGTTVLVLVSPVPQCDPQLGFYRRELTPYVDRSVQALPIEDFVEGDRHMTPKGSEDESHQLAQLIKNDEATKKQ